MKRIARRCAPNNPESWDDMIQEGYRFLLTAVPSWDGRQEFGAYTNKLLRKSMRRAWYKDMGCSLGVTLHDLETGKGTERKRIHPSTTTLDGDEYAPDEMLGQMGATTETPEDIALEHDAQWQVRSAVWRTIERQKLYTNSWQYKLVRDCILSERTTIKDVCKRFSKFPGSAYFFIKRFHRDVRQEYEASV